MSESNYVLSEHRDTDSAASVPSNNIRAEGKIKNVNTIEDFKNMDKAAMLQTAAKQVCTHFRSTKVEC